MDKKLSRDDGDKWTDPQSELPEDGVYVIGIVSVSAMSVDSDIDVPMSDIDVPMIVYLSNGAWFCPALGYSQVEVVAWWPVPKYEARDG
jgi:hypothetical protein